ncbi:radical SAM protein [bacterium]|nr:radical SAM protein [bacterium]
MSSKLTTLIRGRKAMFSLLKCKFSKKRIPVRASFLVTKYCNLRCFYCYTKDILNDKNVHEPTIDELKNTIDQIYEAGCRWINILGGEPLMRDDIEEFINYVSNKGMFMEITTNGFFVKKRIKALKKVDHLCISLDGNKESNDKSRGKGSFEKIVEGIEYAVTNGLSVRVHATLCKRTMQGKSLEFLSDFCNRLKIKLNYSENGLPGIEKMDPDFLLSREETMNFYRSYKSLRNKGFPIISSDVAVEYASKWPLQGQTIIYKKDLHKIPKGSFYPCELGRSQCFITSDGYVYPCSKKWGYGKNLYEVGFKEAWNYLENLDCVACKELGTIEQSLITGLNPSALFNAITNFAL